MIGVEDRNAHCYAYVERFDFVVVMDEIVCMRENVVYHGKWHYFQSVLFKSEICESNASSGDSHHDEYHEDDSECCIL